MKSNPFPEIKTERLLLRRVKEFDDEVILFLRSDKTMNKYIQRPESELTKTKAEALQFIKRINDEIENNISITWGITLNGNPNLLGTICLWNFSKDKKTAEVGYGLNPAFHKKGIMNEALKTIVDFGFKELGIHKIEAFTQKGNESSRKLLVRNGFVLMENRKCEVNSLNLIYEIEKK